MCLSPPALCQPRLRLRPEPCLQHQQSGQLRPCCGDQPHDHTAHDHRTAWRGTPSRGPELLDTGRGGRAPSLPSLHQGSLPLQPQMVEPRRHSRHDKFISQHQLYKSRYSLYSLPSPAAGMAAFGTRCLTPAGLSRGLRGPEPEPSGQCICCYCTGS